MYTDDGVGPDPCAPETLPEWFIRTQPGATGTAVYEVTVTWHDLVLDVRHVPPTGDVTVEDSVAPWSATLVRSGLVDPDAGFVAFAVGGAAVRPGSPAEATDRLVFVHAGTPGARVLLRLVPAGTPLPGLRRPARTEPALLGSLALTSFLGAMLAVVVALSPPRPASEVLELPEHLAQVLMTLPPPTPPVPTPSEALRPPTQEEGAKAPRTEGKRGTRDAELDRARGDLARRQSDKEAAEDAGLLGALSRDGGLDGVFGATGLPSGLEGLVGGLSGPKGTQRGTGLGDRGPGLGGGGDVGTVGSGTRGRGPGDRDYGGVEGGPKREPRLRAGGDVITLGGLDASLVDAVIKKNLAAFRYCYQRELNRDPSLAGKVVLKWVIALDGTVSTASIKSSAMNNAAVEGCMVGRVQRLQFPQPKGGIVVVSYPFWFEAS